MLLASLWSAANSLEMAGTDLATKLFWANMQYFSYAFMPVTWLVLVLGFVERDLWLKHRRFLLYVIPVLTVVLVWTNDLHGLIRQNVRLDAVGLFPVIAKEYGPWFWVFSVYSDILSVCSVLFCGLTLRRRSALYRRQALALLVGLSLVYLQHLLYISGLHPVSRFDLTPVFLGLSGLIISWGIFRYHLFDIVPVARENVIEHMG
jgi:hypothetical protein